MRRANVFIGMRKGDWEIVSVHSPVIKNGKTYSRWLCRCVCGNIAPLDSAQISSGSPPSCGCKKRREMIGAIFGNWTVKEFSRYSKNGLIFICECVCGSARELRGAELRHGKPESCGCKRGAHRHTTGASNGRSPTYSCWANMIARCTQTSNPAFLYYKSKGISVCERWRDFSNFLADMGERPSTAHTLDRWPDNNGNYEPSNCRWATRQEQANNRSTNILFEYRGQTYTLADLARHAGVSKEMLRGRLCRSERMAPWTVEEAVNTPKGHRK